MNSIPEKSQDDHRPIIVRLGRNLRLSDHQPLLAAEQSGRPVIPVFIADDAFFALGAAPKWRFGLGLAAFSEQLEKIGSKLLLRRGDVQSVLLDLIHETQACAVLWERSYDPSSIKRDTAIKMALGEEGIVAQSFSGALLIEPWEIATKTGGFYKVFTPFWRNLHQMNIAPPASTVSNLVSPTDWPKGEDIKDWQLDHGMMRGLDVVGDHICVGEKAAVDRCEKFLSDNCNEYNDKRDFPAIDATSKLSENLAYGEISPRLIWHLAQNAAHIDGVNVVPFIRQLAWRDFAWHLTYHTPHILDANWKAGWDTFPWITKGPEVLAWQRGQTGIELVDAAMRELYVTGRMHNRARMIAASYLTKHLMVDWRVGQEWFGDTLVDMDLAANAMGWQWVAGTGPDASPYFRVFNPDGQAEKFDKEGKYRDFWLNPAQDGARQFAKAAPKSWNIDLKHRPKPLISLADGRARALTAYSSLKKSG